MPEKFNQYSLTETLSKKYSHVTYQASPLDEPERQLVITVFSAFLFRFPHERQNLLQRAQQVNQLQHAHLVPIRDMGMEGEQPFVVREYLPNRSLRRYLKQLSPDRLPLRDALNIILQVGEALAYAHQQNIVHGNIKPENIFLDANGQAVLTDFHLVSRKDACIRDQTSEEYAFCYLAPEQFVGLTDAKSDQYALGCLTYELITGRVPFAAQSLVSMMGQSSNALPAPLSESVADLPPSLDAAVLKTLAQDPSERFIDFSLFLEVIQSVLSPPPAFPLAHVTNSRKNRTISRFVQSAKAKNISRFMQSAKAKNIPSPIHEHNIPATPTSQPSELSGAFSNTEVKLEGLTSEWAIPVLLTKEETEESLFLDSSTEEDTVLLTNTFEEAADPSHVIATANSVFEQYEFEIEEMNPSLASSSSKSRPLIGRTQRGRRKLLTLIFLLLVGGTSVAYVAAFPPLKIIEPEITSYPTQDVRDWLIPHSESILPTQSSGQTTYISIVQLPAHVSGTSIAQAIRQVKSVPPTQSPSAKPAPVPPTAKPAPTSTATVIAKLAPTPTLTPTPTVKPADSSITYAAAASQNTLTNGAQVFSCTSCWKGARVGALGRRSNGKDGTLRFNNVSKNIAGDYTLTLSYSNGSTSDRNLNISINGGPVIVFSGSPTGSFTTFAIAHIAVTLHAGNNTITFDNPKTATLDIDKITI